MVSSYIPIVPELCASHLMTSYDVTMAQTASGAHGYELSHCQKATKCLMCIDVVQGRYVCNVSLPLCIACCYSTKSMAVVCCKATANVGLLIEQPGHGYRF
jgi:hypothetical protein